MSDPTLDELEQLARALASDTSEDVRDASRVIVKLLPFVRLWLKHEWTFIEDRGDDICLECRGAKPDHAPECALDAAFKLAGLR